MRRSGVSLTDLEQTRATLLLRLKADGPEREVAWAHFCELYEPIIAGFARRLGTPPHEVAEVVQHVVAGFFAAQPRFVYDPAKGRFRGYLKACVSNLVLSQRRARARLRPESSLAGESPLDNHESDAASDQAWEAEWERQRLALALARVRADLGDNAMFQAFDAVAIRGQSPDVVAQALGMSRDSVYQSKSRVLSRLRLALDAIDSELGT